MELRDLEGMEAKIQAAEEELHKHQRKLEDAAVLADRNKLHAACAAIDVSQKKVAELYARWEALEARR
jgi:ATP-binding cassette subfamily F protein uup